jgi:hypothetical protein
LVTLRLLLRTATTATLNRRATTPALLRTAVMATLRLPKMITLALRPTAIMATLRLPKGITLALRRTAIMATLRPRKVTRPCTHKSASVAARDFKIGLCALEIGRFGRSHLGGFS